MMASISNAIQFSIQRSQFFSVNKTFASTTISSGLIPLKKLSVASPLELSPENKLSFSPVEISGKAFKFSGWSQLLKRRGSVDFLVTKAAAADGHEIEIADGLEA